MMGACLELLLGCFHRNQTRPFTLKKTCYTVCLDCGREIPYSWAKMRSLKQDEDVNGGNRAGHTAAAGGSISLQSSLASRPVTSNSLAQ
jgi:hypothetical protein